MLMACAAAILMALFGFVYVNYTPVYGKKLLPLKGIATFMAVIPALSLSDNGSAAVRWLFVGGIILCALADIFLDLYFAAGILLFAAAHICFMIALIQCGGFRFYTVLFWAVLIGVFIGTFGKWTRKLKREKLLVPALVYAALLCGMCAAAVTTAVDMAVHSGLIRGIWAAAGGVMFTASDYILAGTFIEGRQSIKNTRIIMALYYGAVFALGVFAGCIG